MTLAALLEHHKLSLFSGSIAREVQAGPRRTKHGLL